MASQRYPLHHLMVDTEAFITTRPKNSGARLAFSEDTSVLFFMDGNDLYEFVEGTHLVASSSSSNSSSASSISSQSSQSSSSHSSQSSSSSAKREMYPENPIMEQQIAPSVNSNNIDIYTVINVEANISQVFNMDIGVFEVEMTGLSLYTGPLSDLTTQGHYIPLEGSYGFSIASTGVEPEFLMSLATKFITSLETEKKTITIADKDYQRIIFDSLDQAHVLDPYTLNATATSGLPVSYTSSDTSIAVITGNAINFLDSGEVEITATQAGDADYEAAESITQKLLIKPTIVVNQGVTTSGKSGVEIVTPINQHTDYTISYWIKATLPTGGPNDNATYFTDAKGYFLTIYGDGRAIFQDPGMGGPGFGVFGQGNGTQPINKFSHLIQPGTFIDGQWQHIAFKRSVVDGQVSLHVDGVRKNTTVSGLTISGFTGSETAYNGSYHVMHSGQSHTNYTTDDVTGTPTWTSLAGITDPENDLWINGKVWFYKAPPHGGYYSDAVIFWDDVNNRWVFSNSPESNLASGGSFVGPSPFANHVVNEVNATKVMYTDKIGHGFSQGTGAWSSQDTGVLNINTMAPLGAASNQGFHGYSDADVRAGNMDDNDLSLGGVNTNKGISPGGGYSSSAITTPRDTTEFAIWKGVELTDADVLAIYNEGHSNYSSPNPVIMGIKGGPSSYYRGGMDDFLMSKTLRNVGTAPLSNHVVDPKAELRTNTNLIKYEP